MTANAPYIKASSYGRPSTNSEDRFFCSLLEKLEYERPKETTDNKKDYTIVSRIFTTPQGTILTIALYRRIEPTIRASKDVETGAVKIVPNKVDDGINSIIDKMRKEQSFHLAKEIAITNH
ncbi:MAG: hypothetical protein JXO44_08845, partial [Clostridia bacterium]|nr:hypothetical protein [Clostridia bacterium]